MEQRKTTKASGEDVSAPLSFIPHGSSVHRLIVFVLQKCLRGHSMSVKKKKSPSDEEDGEPTEVTFEERVVSESTDAEKRCYCEAGKPARCTGGCR